MMAAFVLWHTRGVGMQKCILHQVSGNLSQKTVTSVVGVIRLSINRIHTEIFLEGRVRGDLDLVFSTTLEV